MDEKPATINRNFERGAWFAFDAVLSWINTQTRRTIDKHTLYKAVMQLRPASLARWDTAHHNCEPGNPRWVEHDPTFASFRLGRIELGQVSLGAASGNWFFTCRFCADGEVAAYSAPTQAEARSEVEAHARRVLA